MLMRYKDSPEPTPPGMLAEGFENKVMHTSFRVGETTLMASDGCGPEDGNFDGFSLSLSVPRRSRCGPSFRRAFGRRHREDAAHQNVLVAALRHAHRSFGPWLDDHRHGLRLVRPHAGAAKQTRRRRLAKGRRIQGVFQGRLAVLRRPLPKRRQGRRVEVLPAQRATARSGRIRQWQDVWRMEMVSRERQAHADRFIRGGKENRASFPLPSQRALYDEGKFADNKKVGEWRTYAAN